MLLQIAWGICGLKGRAGVASCGGDEFLRIGLAALRPEGIHGLAAEQGTSSLGGALDFLELLGSEPNSEMLAQGFGAAQESGRISRSACRKRNRSELGEDVRA